MEVEKLLDNATKCVKSAEESIDKCDIASAVDRLVEATENLVTARHLAYRKEDFDLVLQVDYRRRILQDRYLRLLRKIVEKCSCRR